MSKIKTLIVDDEALARDLVKNYISTIPDLELCAECENGFEALKAIQELKPDLVFLDIQMPKLDGFELLEVLDDAPCIIFTTAFDQYAIKAFEMNAVDYLLKPFSKARLEQAVDKARQRMQADIKDNSGINKLKQQLETDQESLDRVVTRLGSKITVIPVDNIWYIEAQDDYVMVYSDMGKHLKEKTMKYFEQHLPLNRFIRIHRSYIVNLSQITSVELYTKDTHLVTLKNGDKLRCSAEGYKRLRELI